MKIIKITQNLYSGAKPSYKTLKTLKKEGITDIYDLRADKSVLMLVKFREYIYCKWLGLKYIKKPFDLKQGLPQKEFFNSVKKEIGNKKVYLHCTNGKHRAGFMGHAIALLSGQKTIDTSIKELLENNFFNFKKSKKLKFKEFLNPKLKQNLESNLKLALETFQKMFSEQP